MEIRWEEQHDDDDNSYWEGASPYHNDGAAIYWRLRPRMVANRIEWYDDHDAELGGKTGAFYRSITEAKAEIQKAHDSILLHEDFGEG